MNEFQLIGRTRSMFHEDLAARQGELDGRIRSESFLVLGGAGSIGSAVARELYARGAKKLHVVDLCENNLAEVARDLRSQSDSAGTDFRTFCLDILSPEFSAFARQAAGQGGYDHVMNFTALKHVRSERDPFTAMRMVKVNVQGMRVSREAAKQLGAKRYFCVSTDKACAPANLMGASKRAMELFLAGAGAQPPASSARFANVLFSDGSITHGWRLRLAKRQPLSVPRDIRRYFITPQESASLCLFSALLGDPGDVFFPQLTPDHLIPLTDLCVRFLEAQGLAPKFVENEEEARREMARTTAPGSWPVLLTQPDTAGEKPAEEFYAPRDVVDLSRFRAMAVIRQTAAADPAPLARYLSELEQLSQNGAWTVDDLVALHARLIPDFDHRAGASNLDARM